MLSEPDRQRQPALAQTRMDRERSSVCDFGLGFRLHWVDRATNSNCWFSIMVVLRFGIQELLGSVLIQHLVQTESACVIRAWQFVATVAADFDLDYCSSDQPSDHC